VNLTDEQGELVEVTIAAPVAQVALSAHADQDGLIAYAAALRPKRVVLVHGDERARAVLRDRLIRESICDDVRLERTIDIR
jgi:Cft2 family RNA processing exonuclease